MLIQGFILCLMPALSAAEPSAVLPRGHVFFARDFEQTDALKGWSGPAALDAGAEGGRALVLERPLEKGSGYATATIQLERRAR